MSAATLAIPSFSLRSDSPAPSLPCGPGDAESSYPGRPPDKLATRYRPRRLAEIVGQSYAVDRLESFVSRPHSTALLFVGPTGVGKTTAAFAVAAELGAIEYGGLHHIRSGDQDTGAVESALASLRFTPMLGSGWKVVIVDEADHASPKAKQLWLSALEYLPPRSVIIFTTNHMEKFDQRFIDRCETPTEFASDPAKLIRDAQLLINDVWRKEMVANNIDPNDPANAPPNASDIPGLVIGGTISFRRAVESLTPGLRKRITAAHADRPRRASGLPAGRVVAPIGDPVDPGDDDVASAPLDPLDDTDDDPVDRRSDRPAVQPTLPAPAPTRTMSVSKPSTRGKSKRSPVVPPRRTEPTRDMSPDVAKTLARFNDLQDRFSAIGDEAVEIDEELDRLHEELIRAGIRVRRFPDGTSSDY